MDQEEFQQESSQYIEQNQYAQQLKDYYNSLKTESGLTLAEGTPLFVDTFGKVKSLGVTAKKLYSQLSTVKEDTQEAIKKASEKIMKTGEESLKKIQGTIGDGVEKISQKIQEGGKDIYKSSLETLDLQKSKALQSLRSRNISLQEKLRSPSLNQEDIEKFSDEMKSNLKKAGDILNKTPEETMKNFNDTNFVESLKNKIQLESKPVLEQKQGYMRNYLDKKIQDRTQQRINEEFERDPEENRLSFIVERDKAIESTKQAFNPISKQYETVNKGANETAEKASQEIGNVKNNFEQVGKEAIQEGKQTIKEGIEGVTSTAKETAQAAIDMTKSAASKASNIATDVAKTAEGVAEDVAKTAGDAAESVLGTTLEAAGPIGEIVGTGMLLYQGIKDIFEGVHHAPVPNISAPIFTPNI